MSRLTWHILRRTAANSLVPLHLDLTPFDMLFPETDPALELFLIRFRQLFAVHAGLHKPYKAMTLVPDTCNLHYVFALPVCKASTALEMFNLQWFSTASTIRGVLCHNGECSVGTYGKMFCAGLVAPARCGAVR